MRLRQALRRFAVVLSLMGSLVPGSGLAASADVGPPASSSVHGPAVAGIYMNFDSVSSEVTTEGFSHWIDALCF